MIALPTSSCKRDASVVEVVGRIANLPLFRPIGNLPHAAAVNELGLSLFDHSPLNAVNFPAELRLPAEPVFVPGIRQFDERSEVPFLSARTESGLRHRTLGAAEVGAVGVDPAEIQNVPVARRAADVPQPGGQGSRGARTDGAEEAGPVVQGIGQYTDLADAGRFRPHDQRQDADGLPVVENHKDPKFLPCSKMFPVTFQPFEAMEEAGAARLGQQLTPSRPKRAQVVDLVDFVDFKHVTVERMRAYLCGTRTGA